MSLTSDRVYAPPPERAVPPARNGHARSRWTGLLFATCGLMLMALAFGSDLSRARAGVFSGGVRDEDVRGSDATDRISGLGGADKISGLGGDDFVAGGAGSDELYGGSGRDVLIAGSGDDFIEARDGARDYVGCGSGRDVVSADPSDRTAPDCETVYTS